MSKLWTVAALLYIVKGKIILGKIRLKGNISLAEIERNRENGI